MPKCSPGQPDCVDEPLDKTACAEANGFLNQTNVATVINLQNEPLNILVKYTDLLGVEQGSIKAKLNSKLKRDFIVNNLGLAPDTYGTVCVETDAKKNGAWIGGVAAYKPANDSHFDFVLYYPFTNPKTGIQTFSMNTFTLGGSLVANWIRLTDAVRDGKPLLGTIQYFAENGQFVKDVKVNILDAGRYDFGGHEVVPNDLQEFESVFLARFVPENPNQKFYQTVSRYFYNCPDPLLPAGCLNFLSAFVLPDRPPLADRVVGNVSVTDATFSVIEIINPLKFDGKVLVEAFNSSGTQMSSLVVDVPHFGSRHLIVNDWLNSGSGYAVVTPLSTMAKSSAFVSVSSLTYKLFDDGQLSYGYASPFTKLSNEPGQVSQFNTFLAQDNVLEFNNDTNVKQKVVVTVLDYFGNNLDELFVTLKPHATVRQRLNVLPDTYGTLVIDGQDLLFRNFVTKQNEYVIPYRSQ